MTVRACPQGPLLSEAWGPSSRWSVPGFRRRPTEDCEPAQAQKQVPSMEPR